MNENDIQIANIKSLIYHIRGKAVILDRDLACLYGVEPRALNQAVKRNIARFPVDFMFRLTGIEFKNLRSQTVISSSGHGGRRYIPMVFTEQGVSMLSAVLNSPKAIEISLHIMRAFVQLRKILAGNEALRYAVESLEKRMNKNERDIQLAIQAIQQLLAPPEQVEKQRKMGFRLTKE
ncbi:MAG: ORF6N domain-containing protein [Fibrobacteres bacterium]|nr:ORF6N domain-containing protein [Fibrobacterota bacterium]